MANVSENNLYKVLTGSSWFTGLDWYDFSQNITFSPDNTGRMAWRQNQKVKIIANFQYQLENNSRILFEFLDTVRNFPKDTPNARKYQTFTRTEENAYQSAKIELTEGFYTFEQPYRQQVRYRYRLRFSSQPFPAGFIPDGDKLDYYGWEDKTVEQLATANTTQARENLLQILRSSDLYQVRQAAQFCGKLKEIWAVEPLLKLLTNPTQPQTSLVREQVVSSLGEIGDRRALPILKELLMIESDEYVRARTVQALASFGLEDTLDVLTKALEDSSPVVRQQIAATLRDLASEKLFPLLRILLRDKVVQVRGLSTEALLKIGSMEAFQILENYIKEEPFNEHAHVAVHIVSSNKEYSKKLAENSGQFFDYTSAALSIIEKEKYNLS